MFIRIFVPTDTHQLRIVFVCDVVYVYNIPAHELGWPFDFNCVNPIYTLRTSLAVEESEMCIRKGGSGMFQATKPAIIKIQS